MSVFLADESSWRVRVAYVFILAPLAKSVAAVAIMLNEYAIDSDDECWKYLSVIRHSTPRIEGGDISKFTLG